jgi:hypothetical protein
VRVCVCGWTSQEWAYSNASARRERNIGGGGGGGAGRSDGAGRLRPWESVFSNERVAATAAAAGKPRDGLAP